MKLTTVNKAISQYGYELVKANGYFYFFPLTIDVPELRESSVMTTRLGTDVNSWINDLKDRMEKSDEQHRTAIGGNSEPKNGRTRSFSWKNRKA